MNEAPADTAGASGRGRVEIRVDLATLAGLNDTPGELVGFGPVAADIARQVTATQMHGTWTWTVTDNGEPVAVGTTRRRPTTSQRRLVEAREITCAFATCRMPASQCDIDRRIPWAEQRRTHSDDLDPGCRHDHVVRHRYGWKHQRLSDGRHLWTSPLGYTTITPSNPLTMAAWSAPKASNQEVSPTRGPGPTRPAGCQGRTPIWG